MIADETTDAMLAKATAVIHLSESIDLAHVADMLAAWLRDDEQAAVQLVITLARLADPEKVRKQAHAAYGRGERSPVIDRFERDYQRRRKAHNRQYQTLRTA